MKKNKLYTANRWNQPAFMPEKNLFPDGGFTSPFGVGLSAPTVTPYVNWSNPVQRAKALGQTQFMANNFATQAQGIIGASANQQAANFAPKENAVSNPFSFKDALSKEGLKNGLKAGAGALVGGLAGTVGQIGGNLISGGLQSGAGSAISGIGSTVGSAVSAVNPLLGGAISVGSGLLGGVTNALFGTKVDEAKLKAANEGTAAYNDFQSNATSFDDVRDLTDQANVEDAYSGGLFSSGSAEEKNEALKRARREAIRRADRALNNNLSNLNDDAASNFLQSYYAFGGPMETGDMGAISYGFMSDYLTQKKRENDMKSKTSGIVPMPAFMPNSYAIGGDLQTNGADWSDGLVTIGAGGSHETNPNEGIQIGKDNEGTPNLVEEGETIYNDYVFSNRILADEATKQMFSLPKKKDITFADISKKLEKEIAERPNDPISRSGFEKQMGMLEEQQERQKQEMEAERAKAAFEALSPEEQTALMQQKAEQEAMAQQQAIAEQQAAMQQPSQEEMLLAQQQQQMADGSEAALGQEPQMSAEGGKLFAPGGYLWDKFWSPVNEYSKKKGNTKGKYQIDKEWKGNIKELEDSDAYKAFTNYILNDATDGERMKYFQWIDANTGRDNKYITNGKLADNWKDMYQAARTDGLYGIQHYTPEWQAAEVTTEPPVVTTPSPASTPRVFHAMVDDDDYIQGELDPKLVGAEVRRETLPNGDTVIYHDRVKSTGDADNGNGNKDVAPTHRPEWLRYAGLFGPAAGLGLMTAGIGKPDTAQLDAAIQGIGDVNTAKWKPLGNYLTYRPLDIWFEQNALNAQSRATDRQLMNTSGGNRGTAMAGLLANGYNSQLASGNLFRQAQEYNDNLRKQVADFNRGTDQFNSEQYSATSRFNADAYNRARQANAQMRLQAAAQKMDTDAGWYNSLYGNVAGLFKGIGDIGTENYRMNRVAEMAARGDFGSATDETYGFEPYLKKGKKKAKGRKMNKKRGLTI